MSAINAGRRHFLAELDSQFPFATTIGGKCRALASAGDEWNIEIGERTLRNFANGGVPTELTLQTCARILSRLKQSAFEEELAALHGQAAEVEADQPMEPTVARTQSTPDADSAGLRRSDLVWAACGSAIVVAAGFLIVQRDAASKPVSSRRSAAKETNLVLDINPSRHNQSPLLLRAGEFYRFPVSGWYHAEDKRRRDHIDPAVQGTLQIRMRAKRHGTICIMNWNHVSSFPNDGKILYFGLNSERRVFFHVWNWECDQSRRGTLPSRIVGRSRVPLHRWVDIAVTWSPSDTRIYVDGQLDAIVDANIYPALRKSVYLYLNNWGGGAFEGEIDLLRLYKVQRSSDAIVSDLRSRGSRTMSIPLH